MACNIVRNQNGTPYSVTLENGVQSELFNRLNTSPIIRSSQQALDTYKSHFSSFTQEQLDGYPAELLESSGEPVMLYKVGDRVSTSLRYISNYSQDGNIEIGYLTPRGNDVAVVTEQRDIDFPSSRITIRQTNNGVIGTVTSNVYFKTLASLETPTDNSPSGIMLDAIRNSIVKESMSIVNGERYYEGAGTTYTDMHSNGSAVIATLQTSPEIMNLRNINGFANFTYDVFNLNEFEVNGETLTLEQFDARLASGEQSLRDDPNFTVNLTKSALKHGFRFRQVSNSSQENSNSISEADLLNTLRQQFTKFGVQDGVVDRYMEVYEQINGDTISTTQLNGLLNELFLLAQNEVAQPSENISRLIVENSKGSQAYSDLLLEIVNTEEYDKARLTLSDTLESQLRGTQLEDAYRDYAMSEVITNILRNTKQYSDIITSIANSLIATTINPAIQSSTTRMFGEMYQINQQVNAFDYANKVGDTEAGSGLGGFLYSPAYQSPAYSDMLNHILALKERVSRLNTQSPILNNLSDEAINLNMWDAAIRVVSAAESEISYLADEIKGATEQGTNISVEGERAYAALKNGIMPLISSLSTMIQDERTNSPLSRADYQRLANALQTSSSRFQVVQGYYNRSNSKDNYRKTVLQNIYKTLNWDESTIASFEEVLFGEQKDINQFMGSIFSLANRKNPIFGITTWLVGQIGAKAKAFYNSNVAPVVDRMLRNDAGESLTNQIVKDSQGNETEYFMAPLKLEEGIKHRQQHIKNLRVSLLRMSQEDINGVTSVDDVNSLVRNIIVEVVGQSSLSDTFQRNNLNEGVIKMTDEEYNSALTRIQPSLDQLNMVLGTNMQANEILTKSGNVFSNNIYKLAVTQQSTEYNQMLDNELTNRPLDLNKRQLAQYNLQMIEYDKENREQMFSEEYYQQELDFINDPRNNGIEYSFMAEKELNGQAGQILSKYRIPGSGVDMSALRRNPVDAAKLRQIEVTRRHMRNPFKLNDLEDDSGIVTRGAELKPFIREEIQDGRRVYIADNLTDADIENMNYDDLITWGMIRRQETFRQNARETGVDYSQEFIDRVLELEQTSFTDAYDFLRYNGAIGLNEQFFEERSNYQRYIDRVRNMIEAMPDNILKERAQNTLNAYEKEYRNLQYYNFVNRSITNIGEVDYSGKEIEMDEVRRIDDRLRQLRDELPRPDVDIFEQPSQLERGTTESYHNDLRNKGIEEYSQDELEYIERTHLVDKDRFFKFVSALNENQRYGIPLREYFAPYLLRARQSGAADVMLRAKIEYLRDNLPSYYTRYTPEGFNGLLTDLREGRVRPSILINPETAPAQYRDVLRYVQINPRYDWRESLFNERNLNPRYQQGGQNVQLKRSKWINPEYFQKFGIDPTGYLDGTQSDFTYDNEGVSRFTPTQNTEDFVALQDWLNVRSQSLEMKKLSRQVSPYRIPRISRTGLEKLRALTSNVSSVVKEELRDIGSYRIDDTDALRDATGKIIVGAGETRSIPRYFEQELEDPSTQSRDYMRLLAKDAEEASIYKFRNEAETQVLATLNQVEMQQFKDGVDPKGSTTLKYLKEYIDAYLYGRAWNADVKLKLGNSTIYLSKFLGTFNRYFSDTNLAFNPFVDLTGLSTSAITRMLMSKSGEYFDSSSLSFANRWATTLNAELLKESGQTEKSSRMIRILETLGVRSQTSRVTNTNFSRGARLASSSAYAGSEVSNLTNTSRIAITVLKDHRLINGRFYNYIEFSRLPENSTRTREQIREAFNELSEQSLWELASLDYGLTFNEGVEVEPDEAQRLLETLPQKMSHLIEQTDGVIARENRTWIQRNPLMRLMTTHKGWLPIAIDRRFKGEQYNLRANKLEAGHYTSVANLILEAYRQTHTLNPIKLKAAIQEINSRPGANNYQTYANYFAYETVVTMMMIALGTAVLAATEDDDNEDIWALQFGALIYMRTFSELNSISIYGLPGTLLETFQTPFVPSNFLTRFFNLDNYSFEEVKSGKYKGLPKIWAQIMRLTVGKRFYDIYDIRETFSAYRHWNAGTLPFLGDKSIIDTKVLPAIDPRYGN